MRFLSVAFLSITLSLSCTSKAQNALYPNNGTLFDGELHTVNILIPEADFIALEHPDSLWNNLRYPITFIFDGKDSVKQATIRLKGNTSRGSAKKSYRIDFDRFIDNQTYQGLETIYLHGNHNDASMVREYLSAYVMKQMGVPHARINHIKLYINGTYLGVRGLVEYIDKDFLKTRFGSNKGNNYKCTWPADLAWLGSSQQFYKDVINPSPERERAYDLKTNEDADDYSRLVNLVDLINNRKNDGNFPQKIDSLFNVDGYLKALAAEVLVGHWDNYYYNKNNYFIYDHPTTKKFEYIPYDMDNTFGVQWGVGNINKRDIHQWGNGNVYAPLTESLLANTSFRKQYEYHLFTAVNAFYNEKSMFPVVDSLYKKLESGIESDPQYLGSQNSTYGYKVSDWRRSFTESLGDHNSFGVKPFIADRSKSVLQQLRYSHNTQAFERVSFSVYPNPGNDLVHIKSLQAAPIHLRISNVSGIILKEIDLFSGETFNASDLSPGVYYLQDQSETCIKWIKMP